MPRKKRSELEADLARANREIALLNEYTVELRARNEDVWLRLGRAGKQLQILGEAEVSRSIRLAQV